MLYVIYIYIYIHAYMLLTYRILSIYTSRLPASPRYSLAGSCLVSHLTWEEFGLPELYITRIIGEPN